ncbi:interleukin-7 receptor subunit alpha isoform X1 [Pelobates fuscus]|uniref:interleukin-7 receptor subunit alpha isoform X1 n=2 Tax=Pelobates fuscus TaxID=191477 RepID=UPI002FE4F26B
MHSASIWILLLFVRLALGESGDSQYDDDEKEEVAIDFVCFSSFHVDLRELFCSLNNSLEKDIRDVHFKLCSMEENINDDCQKMRKVKDNYRITNIYQDLYNVCASISEKVTCKEYRADKIVLGKTPLNLTVSYEKIDELKIAFTAPYGSKDMLEKNVQYEIQMRKVNKEWPECNEDIKSNKMCIFTMYEEVFIPNRNLEPGAQYETRVRAKPANMFSGTPSAWSRVVFFNTTLKGDGKSISGENQLDHQMTMLIITLSSVILLILIIIIMILIFWKTRIKPRLWPEIPDHKTVLEKLCKKPVKDHHISFNPQLFENMSINKVDYVHAEELIEEHNLPPPEAEADLESESITLAASESNEPPNGNAISFSLDNQNVPYNNFSDNITAMESHKTNVFGNTVTNDSIFSQSRGSCDKIQNSTTEDTSSSTVENVSIQSNAGKQMPCGFKVLSWEEAYIAMSAFKTPISATK